jgi:hypothetical protein
MYWRGARITGHRVVFKRSLKCFSQKRGLVIASSGPQGVKEEKKMERCFSSNRLILIFSFFLVIFVNGIPATGARAAEKNVPFGEMISKGEAWIESRKDVWKKIEEPQFPILKGMKIKTGNGATVIALKSGTRIELGSGSLASFGREDELLLYQGNMDFRAPATSGMAFKVGSLSIVNTATLQTARETAALSGRGEATVGSIWLLSSGSMSVKSNQGKLSILDPERAILATVSPRESVTIPSATVSGGKGERVAQAGDPSEPVKRVKNNGETPQTVELGELDALEGYLVEFSKRLEGRKLPPNLDAEKFFALLAPYYRDSKILEKVKEYPVKVSNDGDSYLLTLCDKESEVRLYQDQGKTTRFVDKPYWPQRKIVACGGWFAGTSLATLGAGAVGIGALIIIGDLVIDDDHRPVCR